MKFMLCMLRCLNASRAKPSNEMPTNIVFKTALCGMTE